MAINPDDKKQPFNPNEHLIQIKNRGGQADYLPVAWRIVWFRTLCPDGTIETEIVHLDLDRETEEETYTWNSETRKSEKVIKRAPGFAVFRAIVKDGRGGMAIGTKSEKAASFGDFIEKAETGSIGRALAALGYGTQFTGDEFDEQHRIVDAPVEGRSQQSADPDPAGPVTDEQKTSIRNLCQKIGNKRVSPPANYQVAKELIAQLSQEYRTSRTRQPAEAGEKR